MMGGTRASITTPGEHECCQREKYAAISALQDGLCSLFYEIRDTQRWFPQPWERKLLLPKREPGVVHIEPKFVLVVDEEIPVLWMQLSTFSEQGRNFYHATEIDLGSKLLYKTLLWWATTAQTQALCHDVQSVRWILPMEDCVLWAWHHTSIFQDE